MYCFMPKGKKMYSFLELGSKFNQTRSHTDKTDNRKRPTTGDVPQATVGNISMNHMNEEHGREKK